MRQTALAQLLAKEQRQAREKENQKWTVPFVGFSEGKTA
jgi:hypothetical protein